MPDPSYISWDDVKEKYGDIIPSNEREAFFDWVRREIPPLTIRYTPTGQRTLGSKYLVESTLRTQYEQWKDLPMHFKYVGLAGTPMEPPPQQQLVSSWENALVNQYLNDLRSQWNKRVATGVYSPEEAQAAIQEAMSILSQGGIADPRLKSDPGGNFFYGEIGAPRVTDLKRYLRTYGNNIEDLGGQFKDDNVYELGGVYYDSGSGQRLAPDLQQFYTRKVTEYQEQIRSVTEAGYEALGAEAEQQKDLQEYFDLQERWAAPETEAHRSVLYRNDPHGRTEYDIVIARGPNEARDLGYASFVPEHLWQGVQGVVESELIKNLNIQLRRLDLERTQRVGETAEGQPIWRPLTGQQIQPYMKIDPETGRHIPGGGPSFWDRVAMLTESEVNVAKQMARKAGLEAVGGAQPAGIVVRNERSPLGYLVMSSEEWLGSRKRRVKNRIQESINAARQRKQQELRASYKKYVTPPGVTSEWGKPPSGPKPGRYELPGEKTPDWLTQYVPGLTAGEPLRLGHYIQPFSGQQMMQMSPAQQTYISQYVDISRKVLGPEIPLKPWEDLTWQHTVGAPGAGLPRTRWQPTRQRA